MENAVEKIIVAHFGVTSEQIRMPGKGNRDISDAKHFIWYFLCGVLGYNAGAIAKEYNTTERSVYYAIHTITDAIRLQPMFARHCRDITKELKELELL